MIGTGGTRLLLRKARLGETRRRKPRRLPTARGKRVPGVEINVIIELAP
ncbi:hypothetical protein KEH51_01095 [[Brevibacterium] frigoritolerans]|uniref:Uncharacterized protein n=1 Tax=Peribacillus frigoritolerans TaxID=450367 RepID=A0A941FJD1_9BACI|nr:hypothetical protein [Peribacillus frigoritolerans]